MSFKLGKTELLQILRDWNFWEKELPLGVLRNSYLSRMKSLLTTDQVMVVTGPRRAGKSYLMRQLASTLIKKGVNSHDILIINFEDPRLGKMDAKFLESVFQTYRETFKPASKPYLFLDEIQEVENWEKWVRIMHELDKAHLIISGSNAHLLSRELGSVLTGRHVSLTVFPFSYEELAVLKKVPTSSHGLLDEYLTFGGFPAVCQTSEKRELLLQYFDDILTRDLISRYRIRKPEAIKSLANFYLSNPASLITFNSVEKFLHLSADTIEKFSFYLEESYLFFFVQRFSHKVKEQIKSPRKVYPIDPGLAQVVGFHSISNWGHLAETAVFLKLEKLRSENPDMEIYYWKDSKNREVDFIIKKGQKIRFLLQVCWDISKFETQNREVSSLLSGMDEFKMKEGFILTKELEKTEKVENKTIHYVPFWKWFEEFKI